MSGLWGWCWVPLIKEQPQNQGNQQAAGGARSSGEAVGLAVDYDDGHG